MLTPQDLEAIGHVVETKIGELVPKIIDDRLNDPEGILNVKLDAVQEQLGEIDSRLTRVEGRLETVDSRLNRFENTMLTRHDLERWETGQTERYDARYVRRSAS